MPNARKTEIAGVQDQLLKIRLQAQPIDGKAHDALIRYLAETLGVSRSAVSIVRGHTAKRKLVHVTAAKLDVDAVRRMLAVPDAPD